MPLAASLARRLPADHDTTLVAEISTDTSIDRGGVYRHPIRYVRLRLDATVDDVPRFGGGPAAAAE
ncbi:hypothetical protein [Streptomyces sp. NPDC058623]|uniref:hypothetical protein n=1 Tax=Streptomyces sp. NPDC058623 TaxID=3346563 RepID=UPI003666C7C7